MCKISVALATFNGEAFIGEQLSSIINQLEEDSEIIISDNGSTDRTVEIINSFNDKRITLLHYPVKGLISNFENALKKVSGDIIFLSDQDDVWLENKVAVVKEHLKKYDLIVTDCKIVDENLNVLHESFYAVKKSGKGFLKNLMSNTYHGCCMAFRKELLKLSLPFPKKVPMHDIWLGFIAELFFTRCFIRDKLVLHRRHVLNASTGAGKSRYGFFEKVQFRLQVLKYLPLLIKRKYFFQKDNPRYKF